MNKFTEKSQEILLLFTNYKWEHINNNNSVVIRHEWVYWRALTVKQVVLCILPRAVGASTNSFVIGTSHVAAEGMSSFDQWRLKITFLFLKCTMKYPYFGPAIQRIINVPIWVKLGKNGSAVATKHFFTVNYKTNRSISLLCPCL